MQYLHPPATLTGRRKDRQKADSEVNAGIRDLCGGQTEIQSYYLFQTYAKVAPNHLDRQFTPEKSNTSWVADITYIATGEGWPYLATIMNLYSRKIIDWLRNRLTKELVIVALHMALKQRKVSSRLLLHSDRGSQYASCLYQTLLE